MSADVRVRDAVRADLPRIVDIYNSSISGGRSTADTEPVSVASREEWFARHTPDRRPMWVAEVGGEIVAWIGLSSFYGGRPAYDATAEVSLYVAPEYQGRGLGRSLKERMIAHCPRIGVTTLLSMFFDHNEATRRLNDKLGFLQVGHLPEIAVVGGEKRGLVIAALRISPSEPEA